MKSSDAPNPLCFERHQSATNASDRSAQRIGIVVFAPRTSASWRILQAQPTCGSWPTAPGQCAVLDFERGLKRLSAVACARLHSWDLVFRSSSATATGASCRHPSLDRCRHNPQSIGTRRRNFRDGRIVRAISPVPRPKGYGFDVSSRDALLSRHVRTLRIRIAKYVKPTRLTAFGALIF